MTALLSGFPTEETTDRKIPIVRLPYFTFFLLQRIRFLLSGICPRTHYEIRINKELNWLTDNTLWVSWIYWLVFYYSLIRRVFLPMKNSNVRLFILETLILKTWFFCFLLSGLVVFLSSYGYELQSGLLSIVRFYKISNMTFNIGNVRFNNEKNLTIKILGG